jgi:serine/threonine-protein kinase HipA
MDQVGEMLGVYLEPTPTESIRVGTLLKDTVGNVSFIVDESYIDLGSDRPLLSLALYADTGEEDTISRLRERHNKLGNRDTLPPFFANLLPEGVLFDIVESQLPFDEQNAFGMLKRLGADLPGCVVVRSEGTYGQKISDAPNFAKSAGDGIEKSLIKFSLAGIQLKFSMVKTGELLTMPASGEGGRFIVKFPSKEYAFLPEIEYSAMKLAEVAGVEIADIQLLPTAQLQGIDEKFLHIGSQVLCVKRFDRTADRRIHMEDFAQILGAIGNRKYYVGNIDTEIRIIGRFTPQPVSAVLEMIRRLTVDILLGNGDNHLKNTSLIYPDGRTPQLSPAYDIVPTVYFKPDDTLALKFGGKRRFESVSEQQFERLAPFVGVEARVLIKEVRATIDRANDTWPAMFRDLPWPNEVREQLATRWEKLPLVKGNPNPFAH